MKPMGILDWPESSADLPIGSGSDPEVGATADLRTHTPPPTSPVIQNPKSKIQTPLLWLAPLLLAANASAQMLNAPGEAPAAAAPSATAAAAGAKAKAAAKAA